MNGPFNALSRPVEKPVRAISRVVFIWHVCRPRLGGREIRKTKRENQVWHVSRQVSTCFSSCAIDPSRQEGNDSRERQEVHPDFRSQRDIFEKRAISSSSSLSRFVFVDSHLTAFLSNRLLYRSHFYLVIRLIENRIKDNTMQTVIKKKEREELSNINLYLSFVSGKRLIGS